MTGTRCHPGIAYLSPDVPSRKRQGHPAIGVGGYEHYVITTFAVALQVYYCVQAWTKGIRMGVPGGGSGPVGAQ